MQRSITLLSLGTCAGLVVLSGTLFRHSTHSILAEPVAALMPRTQPQLSADSYGKLPLSFESNQGQVDKQVSFLSHGTGYNLFLTPNEAVLSLHTSGFGVTTRGSGIGVRGSGNTPTGDESRTSKARNQQTLAGISRIPNPDPRSPIPDAVLRLKLHGANRHPQIAGLEELPGRANYFIGNDPKKWRTQIPTYSRVSYKQVYPGIDMVYYGNQKQLEYDWIVAPGADVHQIQLSVKGAEKVILTPQGDLQLHTSGGDVIQHAPVAYQEIDGVRKPVSSRLALYAATSDKAEKRIGFEVESYDHSRPLVIDPVLVYSTYLGGSGQDQGNGIAVDTAGNAYIAGWTYSQDFPLEVPYQSTNRSASLLDTVFVSALNASGTALLYSTYLGGTASEVANAIAVDSAGNAYITGSTTSSDFPTSNAFQATKHSGGGIDSVFVTKLNATGSALVYSTFLGGTIGEFGNGIAVDSADNAYITGETFSTDYPTASPFQATNHSRTHGNAFITKFNAAGSALVYSTYLGGSGLSIGGDKGNAIAVDSSGNAYVTGTVNSTDFPMAAAYDDSKPAGASGSNVFVTKLNSAGSALTYSTYLGGSGSDEGLAIAVDGSTNAYVTGYTQSSNFPTAGSSVYQSTLHGQNNAFLTKFSAAGSALTYSTYIGGSGQETGYGVALDSAGNAYVTGGTTSSDFPVVSPIQSTLNTGSNAFLTKMNPGGSALLYSTYLGAGTDQANAIAVDSYGTAYITGTTSATEFPVQNPLQPTNHSMSSYNCFVVRVGNYNWQTEDVTVGSDNLARLLWTNTNHTAGLWSVSNLGQSSSLSNIGPFAGYTVQAIAAGSDGLTRMLWNKTDGTAGLWLLKANNTYQSGVNYGPYSGWSASDVTVGSDNKARLLWSKADGAVAVWTVDSSGVSSNLTNIGPLTGWTVSRIAAGADGYTRLLWTKTDGTVALWILNANNTYNTGFTFGPYTGWRAIDVAVGSDNKARLLWSKSDGTAGIWSVANTGALTNLVNIGPFAGWSATRIASGGDGVSRLLWFKADGTQALWLLNANNGFSNGYNLGPF